MPKHYLLLGAGFSRNWGGWLANEAFEYLLGSPEIADDKGTLELLWKHKFKDGFEGALAELQGSSPDRPTEQLERLQTAIRSMFLAMNMAFDTATFEPRQPPEMGSRITDFLAKFDAIFTLNQDLLLEKHYIPSSPAKGGCYLPGVIERPGPSLKLHERRWTVGTTISEESNRQPIYKLHGSSNWTDEKNSELLVMGGNKSRTIRTIAVLQMYQRKFEAALEAPNAKLMVIGYGFRDDHINSIISGAASTLRMFVVDPLGTDVYNRTLGGAIRSGDALGQIVIGASRRTLRETFNTDEIERAKIMRFFRLD